MTQQILNKQGAITRQPRSFWLDGLNQKQWITKYKVTQIQQPQQELNMPSIYLRNHKNITITHNAQSQTQHLTVDDDRIISLVKKTNFTWLGWVDLNWLKVFRHHLSVTKTQHYNEGRWGEAAWPAALCQTPQCFFPCSHFSFCQASKNYI